MSNVEKLLSKFILFILVLQVVLCIICALANSLFYESTVKYMKYMPPVYFNKTDDAVLVYFTYSLLLNTLIPISLIISLEMIKIIQGYFIEQDYEMYSFVRDKFAKAGSVSINEELGEVDFIFSDKTGTLTCNKMFFKYCVIGVKCYEYKNDKNLNQNKIVSKMLSINVRPKDEIEIIGKDYFNFLFKGKQGQFDKPFETIRIISNGRELYQIKNEENLIKEYWKLITTCHECIVDETENGKMEFSGLSPDDIELLRVANEQGFKCKKSQSQFTRNVDFQKEMMIFEVLNVLEFSSDRKRMSIIVRDENVIKLYIKGADSEIIKRLSTLNNTLRVEKSKHYVNHFSRLGYRTLMLGMKVLDEIEYQNFNKMLKEAAMDLRNKKKLVNELMDNMERDIFLLGSTIVEDKLQDKVPETIRDMRLAGIKIWMLTGDKLDTALNIGLSCNLIKKNLKTFMINGEEGDTIDKLFTEFEEFKRVSITNVSYAVLIDSIVLTNILSNKQFIEKFVNVASGAVSVICCRVSPLQKSEVVRMMKKNNPKAITLAIGDGGNDVSMIMEAHIGIGVYGEEGMRAVQASDFAIGEFKFLRKLLFFHGRINLMRITEMILYFFYKNFCLTIMQFFYSFYNNSSGQTLIDDWFISLYNVAFTAIPLLIRAFLEKDLTLEDGEIVNLLLPFLYKEKRDNPSFNYMEFIMTIMNGFFQGFINFFINVYTLKNAIVNINGETADLWFNSLSLFTNIVFVVSVRILVFQRFNTIYNYATMLISSWGLYFGFVIYANGSDNFNSYATIQVCFSSPLTLLLFFLNVNLSFVMDLLSHTTFTIFSERLSQKLQKEINERGPLNTKEGLPKIALDYLKEFDDYSQKNSDDNSDKIKKNINVKMMSEMDRLSDTNNPTTDAFKNEKNHSNNRSEMITLNENPKHDIILLVKGIKR